MRRLARLTSALILLASGYGAGTDQASAASKTHGRKHRHSQIILKKQIPLQNRIGQLPITPSLSGVSPDRKAAIACGALSAYHEARSENAQYQKLAASLVYTRAKDQHKTPCSIITQPGVFPWARTRQALIIHEPGAWIAATRNAEIARQNPTNVHETRTIKSFKKSKRTQIISMNKHVVFFNIMPKKKSNKNNISHS